MSRLLRSLIISFALGACFTWNPALAAEVPIKPGQELTLSQAIQIALTFHPRLLERQSESEVARERMGEAESNLLPQIYGIGEYLRGTDNGIGDTSYIGMYDLPRQTGSDHNLPTGDFSQSWDTGDNYLTGTTISQFLFDFGRVRGLISEARFQNDAARARVQLTRLTLIYEVSRRYFALLAAKQLVRVFEQAVRERKFHLRQAQAMARANLKPEIDVYTTQAEVARAQLHLLQAENMRSDAKIALDNAMGLSETAPSYHAAERLGYQPVTDTLAALLRQALQLRPDLQMLKDEAEAAGARIIVYKSDYFPTVRAVGDYTAMGTGLPAANNFNVGIVISWPIFNGLLTTHQVAAARFQRHSLQHAIEVLRQQVYQQVTKSLLDWQASLAEIKRAKSTLDASRGELDLAGQRYRAGLGNIVELEVAQREYTQDSAAYVNALYAYAVAKAAVDRATARSLSEL
jgi:outer membrane protein